jgi:hypothetical protein
MLMAPTGGRPADRTSASVGLGADRSYSASRILGRRRVSRWSTRVGLERRRKEGDFYIAEQEDGDNPAHVCVKKVGTDVFKFRGSARLDPENR